MSWQDFVNGILFELIGGCLLWLNVAKLYEDKQVRGVNWITYAFFACWGIWNLYYYPHLGQWLSFVGGLNVVLANTVWVWMALYYGGNHDTPQ